MSHYSSPYGRPPRGRGSGGNQRGGGNHSNVFNNRSQNTNAESKFNQNQGFSNTNTNNNNATYNANKFGGGGSTSAGPDAAIPMNSNYKGRPENYDPNFAARKYNQRNFTHQNYQAQQQQQQQQKPTPHIPTGPSASSSPSSSFPTSTSTTTANNNNNPFGPLPTISEQSQSQSHPFPQQPTTTITQPPPSFPPSASSSPPSSSPAIHAALATLLLDRGADADGDVWMCGCASPAAAVVTCRDAAAAAHVALLRRHEALRADVRRLLAGLARGDAGEAAARQVGAWLEAVARERPGSEVVGLFAGGGE